MKVVELLELLFESKNAPWRSTSALKERRLREFMTIENIGNNMELMIQLLGSKLTDDEVVLLGKLLTGQDVLDADDIAEVVDVLVKMVPAVARVRRLSNGYIVNYPSNYIPGVQKLWYEVQYNYSIWSFTSNYPELKKGAHFVEFDDEQELLTHIKKFHKMVENHKNESS
jgi:hypothetical protein